MRIANLLAIIGLALAVSPAYADDTSTLVHACPTQPSTQGFSACTNSTWAVPAANLIIDVLRSNVAQDVWITPAQLIKGDRVFACQDAGKTKAGPFGNCSTTIVGQTNNWLDSSTIDFGVLFIPPPQGVVAIDWPPPPTKNADGTPLTDLVGYKIYVRDQGSTSGTYGAPIILPMPTVTRYVINTATPVCIQVTAYNSKATESVPSDEVCATPKVAGSAPGKLQVTVE